MNSPKLSKTSRKQIKRLIYYAALLATLFSVIYILITVYKRYNQLNSVTYEQKTGDVTFPTPQATPSTAKAADPREALVGEWTEYHAGTDFSFSYPSDWLIKINDINSRGEWYFKIYDPARNFVTIIETREYLYDTFNSEYVTYLKREPSSNASTYLFYGTKPAVFTIRKTQVNGHRASWYLIDKQSQEQEYLIEKTVIDFSKKNILSINRQYLPKKFKEEDNKTYNEIYQKILESLRFN